jgi:hypothetical protein
MADVEYGDYDARPGFGFGGGRPRRPLQPEGEAQGTALRAALRGEAAGHQAARGEAAAAAGAVRGRVAAAVNIAGALTSVALVVGLALWGYRLAVRDVTGVPVIRAIEGPARVAPVDPGGERAAHQGLAVNAVTAEGTAAAPADRLVLAPRPVDLAADDLAMGSLPAPRAGGVAGVTAEGVDPIMAALDPATLTLPSGAITTTADPDPAMAGAAPDILPADVPGVAVSPRPVLRPGGDAMAEAAVAAVAAALAPDAALDVDPATLAAGTRLVQLGTYDSADAARADWDRIAALFGPVMDGKRRVIEPAESGGATFYRLRAEGFTDISDARRFCAVLEEQSATCVPAQVR